MKCPVCWRDVPLTPSGLFGRHRTKKLDDTSFCPMSGEPVPVAAEVEAFDDGAALVATDAHGARQFEVMR